AVGFAVSAVPHLHKSPPLFRYSEIYFVLEPHLNLTHKVPPDAIFRLSAFSCTNFVATGTAIAISKRTIIKGI
ncbi:hypothetical protein CO009_01970, partial [Candidatus Shapirobacteria bacterium CG_4_8_14_3_um_filter_35_11]